MGFLRDLFSPVLSDRAILKYNADGKLIENTICRYQLQPNSVDLTLGNSWKKLAPNKKYFYIDHVDPKYEILYEGGSFSRNLYIDKHKEAYILQPGEFVLMASREILNIPNGIIGFVQGRSSIARMGIQTEQAGLIDAGFRGTITFEVFNQTAYPIVLYAGMRIAQVYFFKAQKAMKLYGSTNKGSKYQKQMLATGSRIHLDPELNS